MKRVVITNAKRTAIGAFNGALSSLTAPQLGAVVIKALMDEAKIPSDKIDEVIMGNVITAGLGQAPARQAAIFAGLSEKTECMTINKMCGSGLKSVMLAHQAILCGDADIIIAGGQESMSNAPYFLQGARQGFRLGNSTILDSILTDGLTDAFNQIHMGVCAEKCAKDFNFTREELDEYAVQSYQRALTAQKENKFKDEIADVKIKSKTGETIFNKDEEPEKVNFEKVPSLKPAFDKNGVVTAANASKINDGASALLIMTEEKAKELGLKPLVEIVAQSSAAKNPMEFTTAPADAIKKVLQRANLGITDIDIFEINEAFAVVSLAVNKILGLSTTNVNVNGGAIALGHPIGASGARVLTTLIHEMIKRNSKYGLAALCIGGGEASALIVKKYE
ncbi:MAG: acetyl-CoA C-acyltransferase [Chlorobiaceae bacterium]|nr:acetyl-CoA C-acyltransferase [Chlorobiaceae bacterium]